MQHQRILILDFGAQYTQLIARRVREAKVYCEIHPCDVDEAFVRRFAPQGIILSGSHMSAYETLIDPDRRSRYDAGHQLDAEQLRKSFGNFTAVDEESSVELRKLSGN